MQHKSTTSPRKFQDRKKLFYANRQAAHERLKAAAKKIERRIHIFNHTLDDDTLDAILDFTFNQ